MPRDLSNWLVGVLPQHNEVTNAERISRGLVRIERKEMPPVIVGIPSANPVSSADLQSLLTKQPRPDFILNIPSNAAWTGEAINELRDEGIAFGKMYDPYRGLNTETDLSTYRNPEFEFVERLLEQHHNVTFLTRISDRVYRVHRVCGDDVIIALSQDYEMTADAVRTAFEQYEPFDVLFKTNPYGRISNQGRAVAKSLGIQVLDAEGIYNCLAL
jgi:hypothetical protein